MTRLSFRSHAEQQVLLDACAAGRPPAVERSRPIATTRPPLPLGAPARAVGVLAELRAADRTLGMRRPERVEGPEPVRPVRVVLAPVGRLRLDQLKQRRREQTPVSQLCAAAGLVYAQRHIAAELAPYTAKAEVA